MAIFEDAVRIAVHLPTYDAAHIQAAQQVTAYFRYRYGGSTTSAVNQAPFTGAWQYQPKGSLVTRLYDSRVCIMMIDIPLSGTVSRASLSAVVDDIKKKAVMSYQAFGCKQKAFWITLSDLILAG